jgi:outer membrane protein insertion porin family
MLMSNRTFAYVALILMSVALAGPVWAGEEPMVEKVVIEGLVRVNEGLVREHIGQQTGAPLSEATVSEDIRGIFGLGYFADVRVSVEPFEGGLVLTYAVTEKPFIRVIELAGQDNVEEEMLREAITMSPGSIADRSLIQGGADAIRAVYEKKGYPLARVVPVVRTTEDGRIFLTYQISEGPRVKVGAIGFEGNVEYTDGDLRDEMESREWWFMSWLTGSGRYESEKLGADIQNLMGFYHDRGFVRARVEEPVVTYSDDQRWVDLSIAVAEGLQYRVARVSASGNAVIGTEALLEGVKTAPGELISRSQLREDVSSMIAKYTEKGYALATVYPEVIPDDETRTVSIQFRVNEGEQYRIGRIEITGNLKTRDWVIRREFRLDEGDLFDSSKLRRSYTRLQNLNFFGGLQIDPVPDRARGLLNLDVRIEEKSTGSFNVGGGYSTIDKFVGMADVSFGNLGGRGQYLKLKTQFSSTSTTYEIEFREPWLFGRPVSLTTSLYDTTRDFGEYDKDSQGFSLSLGRRFLEYWSVSTAYRIETSDVYNVEATASTLILGQVGKTVTSSITPSIARDSRDNYLDPHSGSRNSLSVEYAGLGGDNKFLKLSLDSTWVLPVSNRTEFAARFRYGYATGLEGEDLPLYERYYVGGVYSIRGLRRIGPVDTNGEYIGGTERIVMNFDYSFPLVQEARLKGVIFLDSGTAYDRDPALDYEENIHLRYTYGAGIRWISPIGPLRLEWAVNPEPEIGEPDYRWEFAIGTMF